VRNDRLARLLARSGDVAAGWPYMEGDAGLAEAAFAVPAHQEVALVGD
jgi:hypothetical protein